MSARQSLVAAVMALSGTAWAQVPVSDVAQVLTPRHAGAACASVMELGSKADVLDALITTAETVSMPPWVGTRAAHCVALHLDESPVARATAERWVGSVHTAGLALVVLGQLPNVSVQTGSRLRDAVAPRLSTDATFRAHAQPLLTARPSPRVEATSNTP